jgi:hypothetical protein
LKDGESDEAMSQMFQKGQLQILSVHWPILGHYRPEERKLFVKVV